MEKFTHEQIAERAKTIWTHLGSPEDVPWSAVVPEAERKDFYAWSLHKLFDTRSLSEVIWYVAECDLQQCGRSMHDIPWLNELHRALFRFCSKGPEMRIEVMEASDEVKEQPEVAVAPAVPEAPAASEAPAKPKVVANVKALNRVKFKLILAEPEAEEVVQS